MEALSIGLLKKWCVSFQRDEGESSVVYNILGPNVCMGDHKVTFIYTYIHAYIHTNVTCLVLKMALDKQDLTYEPLCIPPFSPARFLVLCTEDKWPLTRISLW